MTVLNEKEVDEWKADDRSRYQGELYCYIEDCHDTIDDLRKQVEELEVYKYMLKLSTLQLLHEKDCDSLIDITTVGLNCGTPTKLCTCGWDKYVRSME